jgi:hypothetical protein
MVSYCTCLSGVFLALTSDLAERVRISVMVFKNL